MKMLVEAYREGLFQRKHWLQNIISGIVVGVVAIPLAMAFAIASGASPEQGLYTAIVAGIFVSLFGGSKLQIAGPTGAFIVILSGITAKYGFEGLQVATMMAGVMLAVMGLLRLGTVIKFIPYPVIIGFTAGIAVVIWVGQWQYFFGLEGPIGSHFHEKLWNLVLSLPKLDVATSLVALISLIVVIFAPKIRYLKKIPAPLLALVVATFTVNIFDLNGVATIGSAFGGIPLGLPSFHLPDLSYARIMELIRPAFAIAILGAIESLLSAVIADGMAGTKHNSNQELIGQGLANIAAPLFGGFAATGAIARTATNIRNGGTSPLAGVIHSLTLILVLLFFAPFASGIPLSSLAAILFFVAWNMSDFKHVVHLIKKAPRADILILFVTFFLTVFVDLIIAVNVGVLLAIGHFILGMSSSTQISKCSEDEITAELLPTGIKISSEVMTYSIDGPIFFGALKSFEHALATIGNDPKVLIIKLHSVPVVDFTGIQALEEAILELQKRGVHVILCGAKPRVFSKLEKAGIIELLGMENVLPEFEGAAMVSGKIINL
ncbi:MAG: sodium-independent anion transporter [Legionellales bacterium RIFCSPHIGHO2_12_FULL_35_11]|nr:MAG: sodium-independent anion transporter [Legionellales bacterium RIFCSPHIGHO2_12_FULL_35_11]